MYKTETELGTAIKQSGVSRDKIFLTTKVITNIADIPGALKTSLKKLQTDYVDLCVRVDWEVVSNADRRVDISSMLLSSARRKKTIKRGGSKWKS